MYNREAEEGITILRHPQDLFPARRAAANIPVAYVWRSSHFLLTQAWDPAKV